jgi:hypothetical protein
VPDRPVGDSELVGDLRDGPRLLLGCHDAQDALPLRKRQVIE